MNSHKERSFLPSFCIEMGLREYIGQHNHPFEARNKGDPSNMLYAANVYGQIFWLDTFGIPKRNVSHSQRFDNCFKYIEI